MKFILSFLVLLGLATSCGHNDKVLNDEIISVINHQVPSKNILSKNYYEILSILPYPLLISLDSIPLNLAKIIEIKKYNYNQDYSKAQLLANQLLSSGESYSLPDIIQSEIFVEVLFSLQNQFQYDEEYQTLLQSLDSINHEHPAIQLYYQIRHLSFESSFHEIHNRNFQAISTLDYALHLMATSVYKHQFKYLEALLLRSKGSILINESHPGAKETAIKCLEKSRIIFNQLKLIDDEAIATINLFNIDIEEGTYITLDSLQFHLDPIIQSCSPRVRYYYTLNIAYHYWFNSNFEQALEEYQKLLEQAIMNPCLFFSFNIFTNIADVYIELDSLDMANFYINKASEFANCNSSNIDLSKFYLKELQYNFLRTQVETNSELYLDTLVNTLFERRELASIIFTDEAEFHLDDFYSENCITILSLLFEFYNENVPQKYREMILNLVFDTKQREIKRRKYLNSTLELKNSELNIQIENCLRQINDFNQLEDPENPIYSKLYQLYKEKENTINIDSSHSIQEEINLKELSEFLASSQSLIYNFIYYDSIYYSYLYDGNEFILDNFIAKEIDSLVTEYYNNVQLLDSTFSLSQHALSTKLFNFNLSKYKSLIFIPDGRLYSTPLSSLIFINNPSTMSYSNYDISSLYEISTSNLNPENSSIFCYSSDETIKNLRPKKLKELNFGFMECQNINQYFPTAQTYFGSSFTKSSFLKELNNDFMHITTHGFSESAQRNNCFLIARNNLDTTIIYSYDISNSPQVPKFVCLSSCETGIGQYIISSGVYSLSRSFLNSGSEAVLKTLWKIDDEASMYFMTEFYIRLSQNLSLGEALHQTKLSCSQNSKYSHPYFWDGFILEGNPNLYIQN